MREVSRRPLHDLDLWIRESLRFNTGGPAAILAIMEEALAENAVELGWQQWADGDWCYRGTVPKTRAGLEYERMRLV